VAHLDRDDGVYTRILGISDSLVHFLFVTRETFFGTPVEGFRQCIAFCRKLLIAREAREYQSILGRGTRALACCFKMLNRG
jgi:hypothetical protein